MIINKEIEKRIIEATKKELKYLAANEHARDFILYENPFSLDYFFMIFKVETIKTIDDYKTRMVILSFKNDGLTFTTPQGVYDNKKFINSMQKIKNYPRLIVE